MIWLLVSSPNSRLRGSLSPAQLQALCPSCSSLPSPGQRPAALPAWTALPSVIILCRFLLNVPPQVSLATMAHTPPFSVFCLFPCFMSLHRTCHCLTDFTIWLSVSHLTRTESVVTRNSSGSMWFPLVPV